MAFSTIFSNPIPIYIAFGGLVLATPWFIKSPRLAISFLFLSLIAGQLIRLPLPGQGGGLLLSDPAAVIVILSALFRHFSTRFSSLTVIARQLLITTTPFIIWSLFTLVVRFPNLGLSNTLIAASYWLRLSTLLILLPALIFLFQRPSLRKYAWRFL